MGSLAAEDPILIFFGFHPLLFLPLLELEVLFSLAFTNDSCNGGGGGPGIYFSKTFILHLILRFFNFRPFVAQTHPS